MNYAEEAERHRAMAEEYRTMADNTPHDVLRPSYLEIAKVYDRLAESEVRVPHNLRNAN